MINARHNRLAALALLGLSGGLFSHFAQASEIDAGFDLFSTPNFLLDVPQIGNDIEMTGVAFGPANTDTIVERKNGIDPFDVGDSGVVDIELVALNLRSVDPVLGQDAYLWVIVNTGVVDESIVPLTDRSASSGQMEIFHENANGGTFDVGLGVLDDFLVTAEIWAGDALTALVDLDLTDTVNQNGQGTWTHTQPSGYPAGPDHPHFPSGGFYVGTIEHEGPHPSIPSTPEIDSAAAPGAFALLLGVLALMRERSGRRHPV